MIEVALPGARVVFTGREQGDVREAAGLTAVEDIAGRPLVRGAQVHGTAVRRVRDSVELEEADGQATARDDVAVMVQVADCLPVAIAGPGGVAMVHAGWRGLAGGVLEEGVRAVREVGAGEPLAAVIGPGARGCCYEVGDEVRAAFGLPAAGRPEPIDLKAIARERLERAGATVHDVGLCTMHGERLFFSHRADGGVTGRQAGVVWRA